MYAPAVVMRTRRTSPGLLTGPRARESPGPRPLGGLRCGHVARRGGGCPRRGRPVFAAPGRPSVLARPTPPRPAVGYWTGYGLGAAGGAQGGDGWRPVRPRAVRTGQARAAAARPWFTGGPGVAPRTASAPRSTQRTVPTVKTAGAQAPGRTALTAQARPWRPESSAHAAPHRRGAGRTAQPPPWPPPDPPPPRTAAVPPAVAPASAPSPRAAPRSTPPQPHAFPGNRT